MLFLETLSPPALFSGDCRLSQGKAHMSFLQLWARIVLWLLVPHGFAGGRRGEVHGSGKDRTNGGLEHESPNQESLLPTRAASYTSEPFSLSPLGEGSAAGTKGDGRLRGEVERLGHRLFPLLSLHLRHCQALPMIAPDPEQCCLIWKVAFLMSGVE